MHYFLCYGPFVTSESALDNFRPSLFSFRRGSDPLLQENLRSSIDRVRHYRVHILDINLKLFT